MDSLEYAGLRGYIIRTRYGICSIMIPSSESYAEEAKSYWTLKMKDMSKKKMKSISECCQFQNQGLSSLYWQVLSGHVEIVSI